MSVLQGTRNVGAEASAYALGITTLLEVHDACSHAVVQCDFLNALAFDCAAANCHPPLLLLALIPISEPTRPD